VTGDQVLDPSVKLGAAFLQRANWLGRAAGQSPPDNGTTSRGQTERGDVTMNLDRRTTTDASIPTSSMADIAFLLIIFFMVTSVFSATKGLEFALPTDDPESIDREPQDAVFIHVQADRVLVDCREMGVDEILPYLEPKLLRNPNKPVILYTDSEAEYQRMIDVYDALAGSGAEDSGYSFRVTDISVPTRSDIRAYVDVFGENPFETACR
jgi:biopolymer transport protein ExbD